MAVESIEIMEGDKGMSRIMNQIDRIIKKYEDHAWFVGGAADTEIEEAQQLLGCRFPEDYRQFLSAYGAGNFGQCEIYGILPQKDLNRIPNGIWATCYLRGQYRMPEPYIAIAFDGYGGYYCINTMERSSANLCPVVLWNMERGEDQEPERAAESFEVFFLSWLKEEIDRLI